MMLAKALASASASAPKVYVEDVFSTWLYTGNGSTQTITNGIDLSGKGGLVWCKRRDSSAYNHLLYDTARGVRNYISSDATTQAQTQPSGYGLTSFNSSGFTVGDYSSTGYGINESGALQASWTFRKAAKFFDVVTYVGDGTNNRQISHSLGSTPGFIIVKPVSFSGSWICYHRSLGTGVFTQLNSTAASSSDAAFMPSVTATTFTPCTDPSLFALNTSGQTFVAYLFAHDAGGFGDSGNDSVVKCGSFNDPGTGVTVDLGWEPQWVLLKRTSSTGGNWRIIDNMRGWPMYAQASRQLFPNTSGAEDASEAWGNPTPTGFFANAAATGDYIYIAIRRGPMKTPTDATKVFSAETTAAYPVTWSNGFPLDMMMTAIRGGNIYNHQVYSRLISGNFRLVTSSTAAQEDMGGVVVAFDKQDSVTLTLTSSSLINYSFRRAPGFFDVVAYTGTQSGSGSQVVKHSLGVAPELLIHKQRNSTGSWFVHALFTASNSKQGNLNSTTNFNTSTYATNDVLAAQPTSSQVEFGFPYASTPNTFIAYLFASCPGVSKCFNYTGTGTTLQVDCGFTNGARLVLIKRTDSTGDWYIWDSARGIISGNDSYLLLNSTAAEVTNTDYIDPYSAGFEISSTAPAAINANGGSYIGLAVA